MPTEFAIKYPIINESFTYNGNEYNVALTPELYPEEDGLDFTGIFHCIVISSNKGTKVFDMVPDASSKWETEPRGVDPGLVDRLGEIIEGWRRGR